MTDQLNDARAGPSVPRPTARSSTLSGNKLSRLEARDAHLSALSALILPSNGSDKGFATTRSHAAALAKARKLLERDWPRADARSAEAVRGLSLKHEIHLQPSLSTALPARYADLQRSVEANERLEREIQERDFRLREEARRKGESAARLPKMEATGLMHRDLVEDVMEVLLQLAQPATLETEAYAALFLGEEEAAHMGGQGKRRPATASEPVEADEPLRGEGWEGPEAGDTTWSSMSVNEYDDGSLGSDESHTSWEESEDETDAIVRGWRREQERMRRGDQITERVKPAFVQESELARRERGEALQLAAERAVGSDPDSLTELEAIREALFALDGLPNRLLRMQGGEEQPIMDGPRPSHLLPRTWSDVVLALSKHCRTLRRLSSLTDAVAERSRSSLVRISQAHTSTIGLESFASELSKLLQGYASTRARWADEISQGARAEARADRPVRGILTLMKDVEKQGAPFEVLESVIDSLDLWDEENRAKEGALSPLVDALHDMIDFHATSMGALGDDGKGESDFPIVSALERCFLAALEPIWSDVKGWIESGMTASGAAGGTFLGAGAEIWHRNFFATAAREAFAGGATSDDPWLWDLRHRDLSSRAGGVDGAAANADPTVASSIGDTPTIPIVLAPIASDIFTTGRSVGLLNALGAQMDFGSIVGDGSAAELLAGGRPREAGSKLSATQQTAVATSFESALFGAPQGKVSREPPQITSTPRASSPASALLDHATSSGEEQRSALPLRLTDALASHLSPTFSIIRKRLSELLLTPPWEGGCGLLAHLAAIQGLFLWQRGGGWDVLTEELYKKMDAGLERLNDPYLLSGIFKDDAAVEEWIDPSLVRFKLPSRPRTEANDPAGLGWLSRMQIQYAVPWPLTYCFTLQAMETYQAISTLLLQLHRARAVVDRPSKIKGRTLLARVASGTSRDVQAAVTLGLTPRSVLGSRGSGGSKVIRRMTALRARIAWILRVLQRYLTFDILEPRCSAMMEQLGSLSSFDDIIAAHGSSIARLRRQCLLAPDQANWTEAVHEILRLSTVGGRLFEEDICGESGAGQDTKRQKKGAAGPRKARPQRSGNSDDDDDDGDDGELGEEGEGEGDVATRRPSTTPSTNEAELLARIVDVDEELQANLGVLLGGVERMVVRCSLSARERDRPSHVPAPTLEERDAWQDLAYELRLGGGGSKSGASPGGASGR